MRSVTIFFHLLLIVAICTYEASAGEYCPDENCVSADHCELIWQGAECNESGKICCSIVKDEYRTNCRQYQGECMSFCNENLQRNVTEKCPDGTVCCVLV